MGQSPAHITVAFRGHDVPVQLANTTCGQAAGVVQQHTDQPLALHTLRLLVPKHAAVQLLQQPDRLLSDTGVQAGSRYIALGSYQAELKGLEASQQAEASLRLPGFDYEAQRAAARSRGIPGGAGAQGKHYFASFKVLGPNPFAPPGTPPPSAALALLHKLACDRAIAAVMERHGWTVPLLSEMPPEGLVGVSSVCILGWNRNQGQEISLRLRTDDYAGFRKYLAIRNTLVHELTHNVWSDHDINFKQLNSQLLKEVEQYEAAHASTQTLAGIGAAYTPAAAPVQQQQQPSRGRTLAAAAGADGQQPQLLDHTVLAAPELARAAALARWQDHQKQQQQQQQQVQVQVQAPSAEDWHATLTAGHVISAAAMVSAAAAAEPGRGEASTAGSAAAGGGPQAALSATAADLEAYEHEDPVTAAAEQAAERLGSLQAGDMHDDGLLPPAAGQPGVSQPAGAQQQQQPPGAADECMEPPQQQQQLDAGVSCSPVAGVSTASRWQAAGQGLVPAVEQPQAGQQQAAGACGCCCQEEQQQTCAAVPEPGPSSPVSTRSAAPANIAAPATSPTQAMQACAIAEAADSSTIGAEAPEAAAGAWSQEDATAFEGLDSVLVSKMQQAGQLVQQLAGSGEALATLADVLGNLAAHPQEPRYRRLRCNNAAFHRKLGRYPAARQLLLLAGFAEQQPGDEEEHVLVYVRDDPGLLWLVLSAVRGAL